MAQPTDYTIPSPTAAFQNAFAFGTALADREVAQQAAQVKAAEDKRKAQDTKDALQSVVNDPSPQNIARVNLLFPALKEQIAASQSVLNEDEIKSANQLRAEVITMYRSGNRDGARARLDQQVRAYKNTIGKEKEAAAAEAILKSFDVDANSVILPMTIQLAESNKDLYKTLFDNTEMTAFQKNLKAAGIDPQSPRGISLSENFAVNQADPIVEIETPGGGKFVGPRSEYFRRYGGEAPQPNTIPSPKSAAERDALPNGTKYYAPDGSVKIKGGQTSTTQSGNFR